ncbi:MAG: NUDIX hydrolase [Acidimicrobiales bacterium]
MVPRPAATVMVVRDGHHASAPLEVLLLRRNLSSDFVGGAHVFPGGAVDPDDSGGRVARLCPGLDDGMASAILGVGAGGLAYWVAAVRECFEEAGLLFACRSDAAAVSSSGPGDATTLARWRAALHARERTFVEICESEGLSLSVAALRYFAHWITPDGAPRRYDTRFFVAAAPDDQAPTHDEHETIAHEWVRPAHALERCRAGGMELVLPTRRNLQAIGRFSTVADLLEAASAAGEIPTVLPRMVADERGERVLLPGDPDYDHPDPVTGQPAGIRRG